MIELEIRSVDKSTPWHYRTQNAFLENGIFIPAHRGIKNHYGTLSL